MSDLQIVLMVIGGIIIAGVLIFNWWQERRFHQQVENNFSNIKSDALLDETLPVKPLLTEPSLDNSMLHDAQDVFDRDDFSINHDLIKESSAVIEEPTLGDIAYYEGDIDAEHAVPQALDIPEPAVAETAITATAVTDKPLYEVNPVNHEGIKAIFEDAFNKNLSPAGSQEAQEGRTQAQDPGTAAE